MIKKLTVFFLFFALGQFSCSQHAIKSTIEANPNFILIMTDDQGWGDTGYNDHPTLKTPHLDRMAQEGLRFERFYSASAVCSPTRGSCITGRHPNRYGIYFANTGHMKKDEITLAEMLKTQGYITGHFGKWHLGTLTTKIKDANRGKPGVSAHYSPPQNNGFDVCFSTESKVPTWDPMRLPANIQSGGSKGKGWPYLKKNEKYKHYGTHYWNEKGEAVTDNLEGDDSRVIVDRVIPFMKSAKASNKPFFAVIWFHAPHLPVIAGPRYAKMYEKENLFFKNYYGCITALDEQIGRLRQSLSDMGMADNTLITFCSDNGPEGGSTSPGTAKHLRGRKRSLYEGGVRVPGLMVWPDKIKAGSQSVMPCVTSDYFTTVMDILGYKIPKNQLRPYDGISLLPLIEGKMTARPRPIAFEIKKQMSLIGNQYKIYRDGNEDFELYDILVDPSEKNNIASKHPSVVKKMKDILMKWQSSCQASDKGEDY